jgi:uncharacterized membrane protein
MSHMWDDNETLNFMIGQPGNRSAVDTVKLSLANSWRHLSGYAVSGLGFIFRILIALCGVIFVTALPLVLTILFIDPLSNQASLISLSIAGLIFTISILLVSFRIVPLYLASLLRAIAAHNRHGTPLALNSVSKHTTEDKTNIIRVYFLQQVLITGGLLCFIVPGLIVAGLTLYAFPLVVLFRMEPVDALKTSASHIKANIGWHLSFYILGGLAISVISLIPIVGALIAQPLMHRMVLDASENAFGHAPV